MASGSGCGQVEVVEQASGLPTDAQSKEEDADEGPPMEEALSPKEHAQHFQPRIYLDCFYASAHEDSAMEMIIFFLPGLALQIPKGGTLLDVGSGPTIHVPLAFRNTIDEFYLSDFAAQNREYLKRWWNADPELFQWDQVIKWLKVLEGSESITNTQNMEDVARSKVKAILGCDVHKSRLFFSQLPAEARVPSQFHVVTSIFCLEYASTTQADYMAAVANISKRVKPGGVLIMGGCLDEGSYYFGGKRFLSYRLSREDIVGALRGAGMTAEKADDGPAFKLIDNGGVFIALSEKPKE